MDSSLDWVVLRPQGIYGPGEPVLSSRLMTLLRQGRLPVVGTGENLTSLTHVENLARAVALSLETPQGQRVYNVSDGAPVQIWQWIAELAAGLGYPAPRRRLPPTGAFWLSRALEWVYASRGKEPPITHSDVGLLTRSRTLNLEAATRDLGYRPQGRGSSAQD